MVLLLPCLATQGLHQRRYIGEEGGAQRNEEKLMEYSNMVSCSPSNRTALVSTRRGREEHFLTLTASMPESCMPMFTTTMVMSCQRTQRSVSRPQTETVWIEDRDRSSSCISSTSVWMSPLLRNHFKAVTAVTQRVKKACQ